MECLYKYSLVQLETGPWTLLLIGFQKTMDAHCHLQQNCQLQTVHYSLGYTVSFSERSPSPGPKLTVAISVVFSETFGIAAHGDGYLVPVAEMMNCLWQASSPQMLLVWLRHSW